jgi:DNA-binding NarL/FixJ family response regulator
MTAVTLLSTDLMDRSKFPADTVVVRSADGLVADAEVVVVDVMRPDALDGVRRLRAEGSTAHIVGFGRHDDPARLAEAREAGCDRVLTRSEFFADVPDAIAP